MLPSHHLDSPKLLSSVLCLSQESTSLVRKCAKCPGIFYHHLSPLLSSLGNQLWWTLDHEYCRHGKSKRYNELKDKFNTMRRKQSNTTLTEISMRLQLPVAVIRLSVSVESEGVTLKMTCSLCQNMIKKTWVRNNLLRVFIIFSLTSVRNLDHLSLKNSHWIFKTSSLKLKVILKFWNLSHLRSTVKEAKKQNSVIKGDVPKRIVQLFTPELASPLTMIFNRITSCFVYPR